ncbi:MAG: peptide chain release factor 2 [Puniceicoccales bacterium]|nr:peptide chain release factor 2 [Puniceicoccales bacterium]
MLMDPLLNTRVQSLLEKAGHLWRFLKVTEKEDQLRFLESKMAEVDFWSVGEEAQKILMETKGIKKLLAEWSILAKEVDELKSLWEICRGAATEDEEAWMSELLRMVAYVEQSIDQMELRSFLSGPLDGNNAIVTIHSGAGGTEACDWANMVLRMYVRWAEKSHFITDIQNLQEGEEAGISRVTFRLEGPNAYGYAKAERGVHRLVRISPFDANKKRHTSFCSVDVIAELEDEVDVPLDEKDLRIDTYRASGKGGQHVNKTESAIRITHLPTGLVVTCQNERSQIKNRATAMKILKSRLYEKMQDEKRSEMERFYGEKGEIGWGYQIRSYVFQPYQMVKDLRTGVETSNVQAVMDGDLDIFIQAWLRAGGPRSRK